MTTETALFRLLHGVTVAANQASNVRDAARVCLEAVCDLTGWPLGHLCLPAGHPCDELVSSGLWHCEPRGAFPSFRAESEGARWTPRRGLPGRVLENRQPVWISDLTEEEDFLRLASARAEGIRAAVASPILVGAEVAGVLEFFSTRPAPPDPLLVDVLGQLGTQLGRVVERARAAEALERRVQERTAEIRREKEFSERLIQSSVDGILAFDRECRYTLWNPAMERISGMSREQVLGRCAFDVFPFLREAGLERCFHQALSGETTVVRDQPYRVPETGREGFFDGHYAPLYDQRREIVGGLAIVHDVTERKRAEEALRESEERYALAARAGNDGLWDWNLVANEVYFTPRWKEMLGCGEEEIGTDPEQWFGRIHPEDASGLRAALTAHLDGLTPHFQAEYRMLHADGAYRWMLSRGLAIRDATGRALRMAGSQSDITGRKVAEDQFLHGSFHDALTGLPNRGLLMDRLGGAVARSLRRGGCTYAVLFLDLDRFKVVNESLGHAIGDQLLVSIGRRLEASLRPGDTVARLGGDEFVILLEDVEADDATVIADRVQADVAAPFLLEGHEVFTTASIGIALGSADFERAEDVLRDAETAMHRAKALGKARHLVFESDMRERAVALLNLETDLRRALDRREFRLHYQPIISLRTGWTLGFEALARWQRGNGRLLLPAEFIPFAEETGLILPIGSWLLREACRQTRVWQARLRGGNPDLVISVNLSSRQLSHFDVSGEVEQALRETGLAPQDLRLEITEGTIMENTDLANAMLLKLKAAGVRLYIDDFGTGYSSLSYLHRLPFDALKIDRSFIAKIGDAESLEILRTIVRLAHNLGLEVIAEGVETAEQVACVRELGCEYAQGFFFSRPLEAQAVSDWIARGPVMPTPPLSLAPTPSPARRGRGAAGPLST